jgi:trimeric autotransporter adhesin
MNVRYRRAISGLLVIVVVSIIVVAAGVGSYIAFNQSKSTATSISSTLAPETATTYSSTSSPSATATSSFTQSSSSSNSSSSTQGTSSSSTSTIGTSSTPPSTSSSTVSSTSLLQNTTTSLTSTLISSITYETSTYCSYSTNGSGLTSLFTSQFPPALIGDLLGNFTQMSDYFNISSSFGNSSSPISEIINASYDLAGTNTINGSTFTLVNYDIGLSIMGTTQNQSGTIYFDPEWNAPLVTSNGLNLTGSTANTVGQLYMIFFEIPLVFQAFQAALTAQAPILHEINETTATFGNTTLDVTNYDATIANETTTTNSCINPHHRLAR